MRLATQIARFAGVGALATLTHVAVAIVCEAMLGFAPQAANLAGFAAAVSLSYFGQGRFTFDTQLRHNWHAPRFLASALFGLAISSGLTQVIVVWLGAPFWAGMAVVAAAVPVATFVMCKFWVFQPISGAARKAPAIHSRS